jgi:hypothetical protein
VLGCAPRELARTDSRISLSRPSRRDSPSDNAGMPMMPMGGGMMAPGYSPFGGMGRGGHQQPPGGGGYNPFAGAGRGDGGGGGRAGRGGRAGSTLPSPFPLVYSPSVSTLSPPLAQPLSPRMSSLPLVYSPSVSTLSPPLAQPLSLPRSPALSPQQAVAAVATRAATARGRATASPPSADREREGTDGTGAV